MWISFPYSGKSPFKLSEDLGLNQLSDIQGKSELRVTGGEGFGEHISKGF